MKKLFAVLFFVSLPVFSQKPVASTTDTIYSAGGLEIQPEYPGGLETFFEFVSKNMVVPVIDVEKDTRLRVYTSFVVEADGSVSDVKALRDPGYGLGKEAVRVIGLCAKWKSGEKNGQKVRARYNVPITVLLKGMAPPPITQQVDVKPEYPGGLDAFYAYIRKNLYLKDVKGMSTIRVYALFTVETDGSMTNINTFRDPGQGIGDHLIKVLKECPQKWIPAKVGKESVSYNYNLPITINLK